MLTPSNENYATRIHDILSREYDAETTEAKQSGESVKLECSTEFGVVTVVWISACTTVDLMQMEVMEGDQHSSIFTPAARCSFRFSRFKPIDGLVKTVGFGAKPTS